MTYVETANQYVADVLSGKIITCKWTVLACQRQKDDLVKDWSYYFDADAANDVCSFLECLTHVKGEHGGQNLVLQGWQCFYVTTVFGWKLKSNGRRRFRRSLLFCGKGQGKSFLSSGLGLYMLAADGEAGAEVVCAARATDQARLVFDTARDICRANPKLCEMFGIHVLQHTIVQKSSASTMKPVSAQGKSLAGKIPHFASCDETWSHRDREVVDEMERGTDKRTNSLLSTISHAGENLSCVGFEQYVSAQKILTGEHSDDRTFCVLYSADGLDWKSEASLYAANPNLGVSVYADTLREAQQRAINIPSLQSAFRSHNLCEWISADMQWVETNKLLACRQRNLRMEDFKHWHIGEHEGVTSPTMLRPFVLGLDLASRQDLASAIFCTIGFLDGVAHYYLFGKHYLPSETVAASPISQYRGWAQKQILTVHAGASNDYAQIEGDILALYRQHLGYGAIKNEEGFSFKAIAYDNWQAQQMSGNLEKAGITAVPFPKNAKTYSPVMDWFTSLALAGRIHFAHEDEVLLWCFSNVVAHRDSNENLFPNKANKDPLRKIDAAIAALYALRLAMAPDLLVPPMKSDVQITFINEDNSVSQIGPDGKLVQVMGPLEHKRDIHPADSQGMLR
jgi:phage terminase large subunit-like protein